MLDPVLTFPKKRTLGRYELLAPIGRGGMAVVWAARLRGSRGFSRLVALKAMLPHLSSDPRFEAMFLTEARIASRLRHPNVCRVLDVGEEDGLLFLVMDWVDGVSLSTLVRTCRASGDEIPLDVAAHLIAQAARGLHAAHVLTNDSGAIEGVVHRDVSPQNLLVTCDGVVQVVDFGIAKNGESSTERTETGLIKGKVAYVAPEQVAHAEIDARADVFALGVVLFELVTGVHPFRGETELATLLAIASDEPAPPIADDVPAALRSTLARAVAKDKADRYASMQELARDLEAYVSEAGGGADRTSRFVREAIANETDERAAILSQAVQDADDRDAATTRARRKRRGALLVAVPITLLTIVSVRALRDPDERPRAVSPNVVDSANAPRAVSVLRPASYPPPSGTLPGSPAIATKPSAIGSTAPAPPEAPTTDPTYAATSGPVDSGTPLLIRRPGF